ncbi:glycoside hydrolase family protein [Pseudomonas fragi]|uniref:Glycoside hydrolase family protein n=1 Tax=Pseudomonas fragi TaxID=296 RepID=A0A449IJW9_PSEFR|nr:glycoside hydrolase family protein [Pseudomonas fragi]
MLPYLLACLLGAFAIAGFWYGLGQPVILPDAATPTHKLQCASYTPFDKDQSPFEQHIAERHDLVGAAGGRAAGYAHAPVANDRVVEQAGVLQGLLCSADGQPRHAAHAAQLLAGPVGAT